MSQTLVKNLLHIIFSTKNRLPLITPDMEPQLFKYMTGIVRNLDCDLLTINGTADHVHLLINLSKNIALATFMENLKKDSSKQIKTQSPAFHSFYWQEGYGAFSVGESQAPAVKKYIANQKSHHQRKSFQDEFRAFLKKYDVPYDERYVWT